MPRSIAIALILAPFLVPAAFAQTKVSTDRDISGSNLFGFDDKALETIRYSRIDAEDERESLALNAERQTELSFSLKPAKPNFSREGGFGLNMFGEAVTSLAIESGLANGSQKLDVIPNLYDGFVYSAAVKVEHEDADINGTAYVSSSQLGLSYGRMGRVWYGGVDVNLEQFVNNELRGDEQRSKVKLDFTTGMRLGWTGLSAAAPLWLLSLQGNFDVQEANWELVEGESGDWYINPSLFWQNPGFTFSAQFQVPVEMPTDDTQMPDYRLRAVFEKQF